MWEASILRSVRFRSKLLLCSLYPPDLAQMGHRGCSMVSDVSISAATRPLGVHGVKLYNTEVE